MVFLEDSNSNEMKSDILCIENLSKSFNGLKLFNSVNLCILKGTINTLFGSNGTGKTTLFNIIAGYEKPNEGKIHFNGMTIKHHNQYAIAQAGIGKMWQNPLLFPNHTVLQNLLVSDKSHPGEKFLNYFFNRKAIRQREEVLKEKALKLLSKFKLEEKGNQIAGSLSFGEKKMLSISMLLMNDASLLLLDEPFSNVSPNTIERISDILTNMKSEGKTVFMIEHKTKFAEIICDHSFKIEKQKIQLLN